MIKVYRFSDTGWEPQFQNYHLDNLKDLNESKLIDLSEYQRSLIKLSQSNKKIIENVEIYALGVWVFIDLKMKNFYLNHLKEAESLPYHELELPKNIMVFDGNRIFEKNAYMTLENLLNQGHDTAYIPYESYKHFLK